MLDKWCVIYVLISIIILKKVPSVKTMQAIVCIPGIQVYIWENRAQESQNTLENKAYTFEILNVSM